MRDARRVLMRRRNARHRPSRSPVKTASNSAALRRRPRPNGPVRVTASRSHRLRVAPAGIGTTRFSTARYVQSASFAAQDVLDKFGESAGFRTRQSTSRKNGP